MRPLAAISLVALLSASPPVPRNRPPAASSWTQWGGPNRNFVVADAGLAEKWPEAGPRVIWSRPLGTGHSAIVVDDGRLFTLYRAGNGRARSSGRGTPRKSSSRSTRRPGRRSGSTSTRRGAQDFSFGAGPHSTPLVVGNRVFTIGTNQEMFAFDERDRQGALVARLHQGVQLAGAA